MKSFRQIVLEVAQPVAGDEADFKAKHVTTKVSHPTAPDHVFSGSTRKSPKRRADYDKGEDEAVYEGSFDVPTAEGGEHDSEDSHQKYKKGNKSSMKEAKKMDPVGREDDDIDNDGDTDSSDKYLHARRRAIGKAMKKEEVEELDEISRGLARSYIRKAMAHKTTGETPKKDRSAGVTMAGKKAYSIPGEPKVRATESVELDEISQEKLSSYYDKAAADRKKAKSQTQKAMTDKDPSKDTIDTGTSAYKRFQRRGKGMTMAANKMKEETELDEARKSDSYQFTHKPGDAESEKRLADLKKSVKGTGKRVVLQGRLGKDNPNAHKYSKDAPRAQYKDGKRVNSDVSGKSGAHSHQRIQKADAAHHDVYVYDRRESVELDEISKKTLGSYIKKASDTYHPKSVASLSGDAERDWASGKHDQSYKKAGKAEKRATGISKAVDRLTKEEVEQVDEVSKKLLRKVGGTMLRKGLSDDPKAAKHMKSANLASAKLYPDQYKNSPLKAKVPATEEVELDEVLKPTTKMGTWIKDFQKSDAPQFKGKSQEKRRQMAIAAKYGAEREAGMREEAELEEKLIGGQKKLDHNKNGKIDAHDFHLMRKKKMKEEVEQLDELSPNTLHSYVKKAAGNLAGNAAVAAAQASSSMKKSSPDVKRNIRNRMRGITGASGRLADKANMAENAWEEVELDEDITKMSHGRLKWHMNTGVPHGSYTKDEMKKERDRRLKTDPMAYRSAKAGLSEVTQSAVKKTITYTGSDGKSHTRNVPLKRVDRDEYGQDKIRESVELTEIFNQGIVKLKDGGSVILKKEDADLLNQMFKDLSSINRKKMQEIAMKDKAGFNEILSFAREAL